MMAIVLVTTILLASSAPSERPMFHPTTAQVAESYRRADTIGQDWRRKAFLLRLEPHWFSDGKEFWYRRDASDGKWQFIRVESKSGTKKPLFDSAKLAVAIKDKAEGDNPDPDKLDLRDVEFDGKTLKFVYGKQRFTCDLKTYSLTSSKWTPPPFRRPEPWLQDTWPASHSPVASPDGKWIARIDGLNVVACRNGDPERPLTVDGSANGYYARLTWSPDSKYLVAVRVHPGDRKLVHLIQSSPAPWGPAVLSSRIYDRPGDKVDTFDVVRLDPSGRKKPAFAEGIDYSDLPWFRPRTDGALAYEKMDRGYGRFRILKLDLESAKTTAIVDDQSKTFVDSTALIRHYLNSSDEIIYSSEKDGWHHLYLADGKGNSTQITKGEWVVRDLISVDEKERSMVFSASGMVAGEDPYYIHYYRISFDGSQRVPLTPEPGNHSAQFSPDGKTLLDTYSTVERAPVHELRSATTGSKISLLEKADIEQLTHSDWRAPQQFVAKGRDGTTDIYGLVFRPTNFDPTKRYPVVEDIYAGPQDSFVPKSFSPDFYQQRLAELGFIVVKIDGMGTRNRSKAFHDVCYKNLADAGFPDRILWMKALAATDPSVDLDRVGIFGTSAGGQNAAGAVLFHPEFYKVAVASCGCHDNRLDKIWWNEQWMGLIGPHYGANSNIENASKLEGNLLLIVGELDSNVPPESTYRLAAALQVSGKEFELVVIPNSDHTAGGIYGERKRRDFLVRHLLGVEPPNPNIQPPK
ncbi:MAG: prolyl oligopeptidase family serine peptidase [Armatimonadetes bacterium]|nr:prolyl oligopeptidase family serine peptidase [Armatimonadota bacterium]